MALLWRAAATAAARRQLGRPSSIPTAIHGRRASSYTSGGTETTTKQSSKSDDVMIGLLRLGVWIGAAAFTAIKVNEKDIGGMREELQKKADEKDMKSVKEELQRLQTANALLSRCVILLQEEQAARKQQIAGGDVDPCPAPTDAVAAAGAGAAVPSRAGS